jgi:hypothetical protein
VVVCVKGSFLESIHWYVYTFLHAHYRWGATIQNRLLSYVVVPWPLLLRRCPRPAPPTVQAGTSVCRHKGLPCLEIGKIGSKSVKIAPRMAEKRLKRSAPAIKQDERHRPHAFGHRGHWHRQRNAIPVPMGPLGAGCSKQTQ